MGSIVVELYNDHAPRTCLNFSTLASRNYYNGTIFHRIISDFMIQGGDPTGTGRGGASIFGEKFEDEIRSDLKHTGAGILSMANSGPSTRPKGWQYDVWDTKLTWNRYQWQPILHYSRANALAGRQTHYLRKSQEWNEDCPEDGLGESARRQAR
jgi:hypothetical protein